MPKRTWIFISFIFFHVFVFLLPVVQFGNGRPCFPESGWRLAGPQHHWRSKRKSLGKYVLQAGGKGGRGLGGLEIFSGCLSACSSMNTEPACLQPRPEEA